MTLSGIETANLLRRGADYMDWMTRFAAFNYLSAGPTADVRINPRNPNKIQLSVSSNSEGTQHLDLVKVARVIGGPALASQLEDPVSELDVPAASFAADGTPLEAAVHHLNLYEAEFTTVDGIDVSLVTIGSPMTTEERRHQSPEIVAQVRNFAEFLGGVALPFDRVNIMFREQTLCHAWAVIDPPYDWARAKQSVSPEVLSGWHPDRYGRDVLTAEKTAEDGADWRVSIHPEDLLHKFF